MLCSRICCDAPLEVARTVRQPRPLYGCAAFHGNCVLFAIDPTGDNGNITAFDA